MTGVRVFGSEGEGHYPQLILTLGLSLILANGGLILFGSTPENIRTPLSATAWELGPFVADQVSMFLNKARSVAFLVSIAVALALYFFVTRSRIGKTLRAAADNPEAATYMGIDVDRAHRIAFGLGCAITALAGGLVATYYPFQPYVGLEFVIIMYAGVVLGGMGSIGGAFWGGLTIGLVQQLSTLVLPVQLQNAAIFVVFLLIVLLRPRGPLRPQRGARMTERPRPAASRRDLRVRGGVSRARPRGAQPVLPADADARPRLGDHGCGLERVQRLLGPGVVRPRVVLRARRVHRDAAPREARRHAVDRHPDRHAGRRGRRRA